MFSRICSLIAIFAMVLIYVGTASAYKFYIDAEEPSTPVKAPFELKKDKADAFGWRVSCGPTRCWERWKRDCDV